MGQLTQLQHYRWEGVYAADFTVEGVRQRVAALGELAAQRGWTCLVAFDTRFMAGRLALDAYQLLCERGVSCLLAPSPAPFPAIERALEQRRADCALIMTAGNRAFWYGGVAALTPPIEAGLLDAPLPELIRQRPFPPTGEWPEAGRIDLRALYAESLRGAIDLDLIRRTSLTLFVDPMSGSASGYIPAALGEGSQAKAIEINREVDPLFGRQTPHPSEAGLARLRKLVRESDSHLGVALSADGRLLGVADNQGEALAPDEIALVLAAHLSRQQRQRDLVIAPAGPAARAIADRLGLRLEQPADLDARLAGLSERERGALLVGVSAEGAVQLGRGPGADAILAALLVIEAVARAGKRLRPLLAGLLAEGGA